MKALKKMFDILSNVLLAAFILVLALLVGVRLFGIEPHIVLSGSMEPEIKTGALVYVKRLSPKEACELKAGETITFVMKKSGTKVTHKIYEVVGYVYLRDQQGEPLLDANGTPLVKRDSSGNPIVMYTTYGINNKNTADPSGYTLDGKLGVGNLASSEVFGKPIFSIPLLGYASHFLQSPQGKCVAIAFCVLLLGSTLLSVVFRRRDSGE